MWPLAIVDVFREPDDATDWSRLHARQAVVFGIFAGIAYVILLAVPLIAVVAIPELSTTAIVWLYAVALLVDVAAAIALAGLAFWYRARAVRGELFAIPLVTPVADRFARRER